ncbi:MAG: GIY-YIG nuclease family protein, partial [Fuerstiella sp.]|nr:GIY-YIG nuclease family protein [Fuerstiella sp.]
RGIRIAEMTTRTVQTVLIPQNQLKTAKTRPELDQIAVYFLFGESDEQARPICYIGQTEDLRTRLDNHSNNKDFWSTAVVAISKTQAFTPAHIRWLEWHCVQQAGQIGRYSLDNSQNPREPFVTEPLRDDCLDAFDTISILLTALGYPVFEAMAAPTSQEIFTIKGPDAEGRGVLTEDGFLVRKGSLCRKETVESARSQVESARSRLIDDGILTEHNDAQYVFAEDYIFNTPSGAAMVVLGRSSNGWVDWKNKQGQTLHDAKRATTDAEASDG